jgi:hypothetical protein
MRRAGRNLESENRLQLFKDGSNGLMVFFGFLLAWVPVRWSRPFGRMCERGPKSFGTKAFMVGQHYKSIEILVNS